MPIARAYARENLLPRVTDMFINESNAPEIFTEMGAQGLLGVTIKPEYGGAGASYVSYGLVAREVEAIDSGYRSMMSVQSSLVMHPINTFGSEERSEISAQVGQRRISAVSTSTGPMPALTRRVCAPCQKSRWRFCAERLENLDFNAPIADVFVVWAKSAEHDDKIKGFILEKGMQGLSAPKIENKLSLRASITGMIMMEDVFVPEENILPEVEGA